MLDLVNISNPEKIIFKDTTTQKKLGAFYTPEPYCQLGAELVRKAIERVPAGFISKYKDSKTGKDKVCDKVNPKKCKKITSGKGLVFY